MADFFKKSALQIFIHLIIWGIITIFPLFFLYSEGEREFFRFLDFSAPILFLMIVFYLNYLFFINRYLFNRKIWKFFAVNLLIFIVCLFFLDLIKDYFFTHYIVNHEQMHPIPPRSRMKDILLFRDIISMVMTVGLATAIKSTTQWYHSVAEQKEKEKLHIESELNHLKHQLNPHFLFNTLNNIYSLISINQENAQNAVHQLSKLMRYVLYDTDQTHVALRKDLAFTSHYIQLMSLRMPSHVKLDVQIMEAEEGEMIAPLLFISLVENAFKYGVSPTLPSSIAINISKAEKGKWVCRIENSNFPKDQSNSQKSGLGLNNLKKRLDILYPSKYELLLEDQSEKFTAILKLKI